MSRNCKKSLIALIVSLVGFGCAVPTFQSSEGKYYYMNDGGLRDYYKEAAHDLNNYELLKSEADWFFYRRLIGAGTGLLITGGGVAMTVTGFLQQETESQPWETKRKSPNWALVWSGIGLQVAAFPIMYFIMPGLNDFRDHINKHNDLNPNKKITLGGIIVAKNSFGVQFRF